ncbi:MAG: N-acetylmuramoyl-L-alanine amidase [Bryobacterales bacterium]|nr:N-acetylmuramoyl-L-alanine amidase [Bryobacterales bacterium]
MSNKRRLRNGNRRREGDSETMPVRLNIPQRLGRHTALLVVCLLLSLVYPAISSAASLQEIRFWSLGEVTRVVVQFDGDFSYKWNRLEDPPRAFFDLPNVDLAIIKSARDRGRIRVMEVNDLLLRQIRYAENNPGTARVVLDLNESCEVSTSQLANPARLVIELRTRNAASPEVQVSRSGVVDRATPGLVTESASEAEASPTAISSVAFARPAPERQTTPAAPQNENKPVGATESNAGASAPPAPRPVEVNAARVATVAANQALESLDGSSRADAGSVSQAEQPPQAESSPPTLVVQPEPAELRALNAPEAAMAKPARRTANGSQSLVRALGLKIGRVVIDPGHGGKDHGTTGVSGLKEKDLVLDVSKRLANLVRERLGSEVLLTREDDNFVSLEERTEIANQSRADLFISVHANSSPYKLATGSETFFLNFTSSREAMDVAARENASSQRSVAELQDIVRKIALKDKRDESEDFAARIQSALFRTQRAEGMAPKNRGVKSAPFIVLVGAEMPSILVEIGFLSNAKEEAALKTPEYRQKMAEALLKGLETYMDSLSHFEGSERAAARE